MLVIIKLIALVYLEAFMSRKGLSSEIILNTAADLISERGEDNFSMRELAERLGIKTSSLYNHTASMQELLADVGKAAILNLNKALEKAVSGKKGKDSLMAMAIAYRGFAKHNPELYKMILSIPSINNKTLSDSGHILVNGLYDLLEPYIAAYEERVHFARAFRSAMHGFISLEHAGFFKNQISADDSYMNMVKILLSTLTEREDISC
jgi:AcrR family transcriptional regulator